MAGALESSRLYQDLHLDHRDAMYRAMTFIERQGGPPLPGDRLEMLTAQRAVALDWLRAQRPAGELLAAYERFVRLWSPVFPESADATGG